MIRLHAVSLGWTGPVYSIQVFGVAIVYLGIYFINSPLEAVTNSFCYILLLAAIVVILHEVYLMLRHLRIVAFVATMQLSSSALL